MLNEEKIRYMTELAVFEKNEGRKIFPINQYFKRDFIGAQLFRSFFGFTFSYMLLFLLWVLYELEALINGMGLDEVIVWAGRWGIFYLIGLTFYLLITGCIYSRRYEFASRSQLMYISKLKHLVKKYGKEKPERTRDVRGGMIR